MVGIFLVFVILDLQSFPGIEKKLIIVSGPMEAECTCTCSMITG